MIWNDNGWTCVSCQEWFEVVYNTGAAVHVNFCPLCGYEYEEKDVDAMEKAQDIINNNNYTKKELNITYGKNL